jgi:hypothetical protein
MRAERGNVGTMERVIAAGVVLLSIVPSFHLSAQHFSIGPQLAFGDYREVSSDLHYRGVGGGAMATVTWKKFSAEVAITKLTYKPTSDGTATQQFDARETDVRLRYYVSGPISAELGFVSRTADPEFEAQSMSAVTAGAHMSYLLGPGVHMALNGGLMVGPRFSGGGTISPLGALHLGLGLNVEALRGRLRFNGDYDFQRISRKTNDGSGELPAPIQQSLGRAGVAVAF